MRKHTAKQFTLLLAVLAAVVGLATWRFLTSTAESSTCDLSGFVEATFVDRVGVEHTFLVFVPQNLKAEDSSPLLLFLNGRGENGFDGYWTIENNFGLQIWENKQSFPFVCAIPQCAEGEDFYGDQLEVALEFADFVAKEYGTDSDRFYVTGVSQGGDGVWNAINKYPDRFAAAVPLCGRPRIDAEKLAASGLPIWNLYNQGDKAELVQSNQETRQGLIEAGASPIATQYKQGGHDCWNLGYRSVGMWDWLVEQRRSPGRSSHAPFTFLSPQQVLESWTASVESDWSVSKEKALAAATKGSEVESLVSLTSDRAYRQFEFHADAIFDETATVCRLALVDSDGDSQTSGGLEIVLPLSGSGIGGVRGQNGAWIASLAPEAQRQLQTDFANDIRIACHAGQLEVRINGWLAVEASLADSTDNGAMELRPGIVADEGVVWKNLRVRAAKEQG